MMNSTFEACTNQLEELLIQGIRRSLAPTESVALLFSGGLDSCILAVLLSTVRSASGPLFVAGSNAAKDVSAARQAATDLGLPLEICDFAPVEVAEALPSILATIGCTDVLQVSLAVPLHFAAARALELGIKVLVSGQGADELFGGYARYEHAVLENKTNAVNAMMQADLQKLLQTTFPYQEAVAHRHAIQLAAPYLDDSVIAFAQGLPIHHKLLRTNHTVIRKRILRNLAANLRLPASIVDAPKRAAQYGSGSVRLLTELAMNYWRKRAPRLSAREARTQDRIRQFLDALKEEKSPSETAT